MRISSNAAVHEQEATIKIHTRGDPEQQDSHGRNKIDEVIALLEKTNQTGDTYSAKPKIVSSKV
jgi:hypothetical protein